MEHTCLRFDADDPVAVRIGLGAAALRYASWGYAVLPLARGGKAPHAMLGHSGGVHWATRDERWIWHWWSRDPAAGIGVACGQASGLVVVDLDVKNGANGTVSFTGWLNEHALGLPPMPTAVTPSGGYHLWLRVPPVRVMITGSQEWDDAATITHALAQHWGNGSRVLVSGHCPRGADAIAERIWDGWGGRIEPHPADWGTGRGAGYRRSTEMAGSRPAACLAFIRDHSGGSTHAASEAERCGVPVRRWVWPGQQGWPDPVPLADGVRGAQGILAGVDIKGDGGYVVAAPSRVAVESIDPAHGDGAALVPYRWAAGCPCSAPITPGWLISWAGTAVPSSPGGSQIAQAPDPGSLAHTGIPRGERNATLHRLACHLYGKFGTTPAGCAAVAAWVQAVLARTDRAGFGDAEVRTTLDSARRWVEAQHDEQAGAAHPLDPFRS